MKTVTPERRKAWEKEASAFALAHPPLFSAEPTRMTLREAHLEGRFVGFREGLEEAAKRCDREKDIFIEVKATGLAMVAQSLANWIRALIPESWT